MRWESPFPGLGAGAVAVIDVVSRCWLATCVSAEEPSTQVEVAFIDALVADGKEHVSYPRIRVRM